MSAAGMATWDVFGGIDLAPGRIARRVGVAAGRAASKPLPAVHGEEKRLEPDGQAIVRRCLAGDSGAWAELVRTHHGRVYGLCYRFTGSSHDAEDLTQDVFLKVYGNLRAFDGARGSFGTWITAMTRNLLVDHFRRSKQQRATDSMDAGWDESEGRTHADRLGVHLEDKGRSPHDNAVQRELEVMVQQALTKVSPELREAVILRDLQDMDYKEIALVLRVPEGTVKSRISRGRAELARLLDRKRTQVS
jgi:RNA polymerase sigma-70 factor (ECF subfamily)